MHHKNHGGIGCMYCCTCNTNVMKCYLTEYVMCINMRRLTTGIPSEKCFVRRFRRCANIIVCTYTNLDRLFSSYQFNAHFLYSITIYILNYNPQHVSCSTLLIFRRTNCIITASGIVTLCKRPYSMQSALNRHTVRLFTEGDDTRCCSDTIGPPEDEQSTARNMLRIIM
jgi:hypothetical protein